MGICCCIDAPDDWTIRDEARPNEAGAGWLKKQGKTRGNWSKRFFSLTPTKLIYYTDETRTVSKGEILLIGSSVRANDAISKKKFFAFTISHPLLGNRELCAKTALRREQWITTLTNVIAELEKNGAMYGTLLKKGGIRKNEWQERWCVLAGCSLTYFENKEDSLPKGEIGTDFRFPRFTYFCIQYFFIVVMQSSQNLRSANFPLRIRSKWTNNFN